MDNHIAQSPSRENVIGIENVSGALQAAQTGAGELQSELAIVELLGQCDNALQTEKSEYEAKPSQLCMLLVCSSNAPELKINLQRSAFEFDLPPLSCNSHLYGPL